MLKNTTLDHGMGLNLCQALWSENNMIMGEGGRSITKSEPGT